MGRRRDAVAAAAVFAAGFIYLYLFRELGWFMEDEGVLYYHYLRVYQGLVPYRDFFTGYAPLIYYVHAAAFSRRSNSTVCAVSGMRSRSR